VRAQPPDAGTVEIEQQALDQGIADRRLEAVDVAVEIDRVGAVAERVASEVFRGMRGSGLMVRSWLVGKRPDHDLQTDRADDEEDPPGHGPS
jgi:hypothetical protein